MKFLVVIPSIRQGQPEFEDVMAKIRASFTHPTDFHLLDGKAGKAQTLNQALHDLVEPSDCDIYVTMDDDYIPGARWQDTLAAAFEQFPKWGAVGIWLGDSPELLEYMDSRHIGEIEERNGIKYRPILNGHHVVGCMVAFRRQVALDIGKTPESDQKYQFWEDGYRGRRVRKLGWEQAFVYGELPQLVPYKDTKEYLEAKEQDIQRAKPQVEAYMVQGGVGASFGQRLKGWIKRRVGR